jgi:outer membrane protein assembly factor BamB
MKKASRTCVTVIVAAATAIGTMSPGRASSGWSQEGYDSGHSSANTQEWRLRPDNVGRLRLLWTRSIRTTEEGWTYEQVNLPVVRAAAYAWWLGEGAPPPRSVALSTGTGTVIWSRSREWTAAAASGDQVYVNAGHRVVSVDARTGEPAWARWGVSIFAATPSVDGLFVRSRDGVGMIASSTGEDVWWRDGIVVEGSPLASGGVVVARAIRDGPDAIVALDAATGAIGWERRLRKEEGGWNFSHPEAAAEGLLYVVSRWTPVYHATTIRALRLDDGRTVWRRVVQDDVSGVSAVGGGRLFVTRARCATPDGCVGGDRWRERGALLALDAGTGGTLWTLRGVDGSPRPLWGAGALADGLLYVAGVRRWSSDSIDSTRSRVAAITAATGRIRWTADIPRAFAFVAALADGQVYAVTAGGQGGGHILAFGLPSGLRERRTD